MERGTWRSLGAGPEVSNSRWHDDPQPPGEEVYTTDRLSRGRTIGAIAVAALAGGGTTLLAWYLLHSVAFPAFNTSYVLRALSTAGSCLLLLLVGWLVIMWLRDDQRAREEGIYAANGKLRPRWRVWLTYVVLYLSPAGLVVTATGVPLAATPLYLDGLQSDQAFRTQFLTRLTETAHLEDMAYLDLPSYYPGGWFWVGGRFANLLNLSGWEAFQPWALVSMAAAGCVLVPVWQRITSSLPVSAGIAMVSVCLVLTMAPEEPYAAIIALGAPAATLIARRALIGSWFATAALIIYLGLSATMYTLFTGAVALSVLVIATLITMRALHHRRWVPPRHLGIIAVGSAAISLLAWGPYFWTVWQGAPHSGATATHYLPPDGVHLPVPFLAFSVVGVLCLAGLIHLIVALKDPDIRTMGISLVCFYVWALASMIAPLLGNTLLGYRLESVIVLQFAAAGVLGFAKLRLMGMHRIYPDRMGPHMRRVVTSVLVVAMCAAGLSYVQIIPGTNQASIDYAYTDTDGNGERADRFEPDSASYYPEIRAALDEAGYTVDNAVVLTEEKNFLATSGYHSFQAFTSHYANPLGEFGKRNDAISEWATLSWEAGSDPAVFAQMLSEYPWQAPNVFLFRGQADDLTAEDSDGWKTHIAEDIFPNYPNVRYTAVFFNPAAFADPSRWSVSQIGPFVVVTAIAG